ncbi:conjugative coupling factor TraD, PFGI-1 class, partial [Candidatus Parcubacteria bacterium]
MNSPFDNRLRPAFETVPALAIAGTSVVLMAYPQAVSPLIPEMAWWIGLAGLPIAAWRSVQALRVWRYRQHLKRLPKYQIQGGKIPWSRKRLFLGRGFPWGQRHVQRLVEVRSPQGQALLEPGPFYRLARSVEVRSERWRILAPIARLTAWDSPINPVRPLPPVGGDPALHGIGADEERDVWLDLS